MESQQEQLRARTKRFALDVIRFSRLLPRSEEARVIGRQLLRSATSVGANYRATQLGRSKAEFTARMGIVVEEANETVYWLELLLDSQTSSAEEVAGLLREANELLRIFGASLRTLRERAKSAGANG